ncbi:MAG TPA: hypothetical protein VH054_28240 [Polyangiaceae bacterium]|jgi:hypothetical protein|nr:hypothetical protein [Polyangiaceae bacterium]
MPKKPNKQTKKPSPAAAPAPAPEVAPKKKAPEVTPKKALNDDAPFALRLAVLEDVVRRATQETRAFGAKLDTFTASQTELARRVSDVEKRAAR